MLVASFFPESVILSHTSVLDFRVESSSNPRPLPYRTSRQTTFEKVAGQHRNIVCQTFAKFQGCVPGGDRPSQVQHQPDNGNIRVILEFPNFRDGFQRSSIVSSHLRRNKQSMRKNCCKANITEYAKRCIQQNNWIGTDWQRCKTHEDTVYDQKTSSKEKQKITCNTNSNSNATLRCEQRHRMPTSLTNPCEANDARDQRITASPL